MSSESPKLSKPPMFKRGMKIFGRSLLTLIYVGIVAGLIVAAVLLWDTISNPTSVFDLFGTTLQIWVIAIIVLVIIGLPGLYGLLVCTKMLILTIKRQDYKLHWLPKTIPVGIVILAIFTVNFYVPTWSMYLGITPSYGPYLAFHGEGSMLVSWDTSTPSKSIIYWGSSASDVVTEAIGGEVYWTPDDSSQTLHHAVKLSNLQPNATYYYRVPSLDNVIHSFRVAPLSPSNSEAPETVIFTIVGDTQGGYNIQRKNIQLMMQDPEQPLFNINTGDLVNSGDAYEEWAMLFNSNSYGRIFPSIPFMASSGNHDTWCRNSETCSFRQSFDKYFQYNLPGNRIQLEGTPKYGQYYSYNYSNVHMVALDNFENQTYTDSVKQVMGTYFTTAQLQWLDADLSRNSNNWKFLYFHVPMYSDGDFGSNENLSKQLEPIISKYGVDAVFYGHDHMFESFFANRTDNSGGTYHFIVGGGGGGIDNMLDAERYAPRHWESKILKVNESSGQYSTNYGSQYQLYGELTHHYMKVKVVDQTAIFTAIRTDDGTIIQTYTVNRTY